MLLMVISQSASPDETMTKFYSRYHGDRVFMFTVTEEGRYLYCRILTVKTFYASHRNFNYKLHNSYSSPRGGWKVSCVRQILHDVTYS